MRAHKLTGFTLLEVMIALLIVSVGVMALVQASQSSASVASTWRAKSQAWLVADQVMLGLYQRVGLAPGVTSGQQRFGGQVHYWQVEVKTTDNPRILRLDLAVGTERRLEHAEARLTGFKGT